MAATRLADMATELGAAAPARSPSSSTSSPQVDLLWRIAGFLFHKRWETREAAALALEKVGCVMDLAGLAQGLFGVALATGEAEETATAAPPPSAGTGLLSFASLDVVRVLAGGEPLLASTGEEYQLDVARETLSREELERQKTEIIKRLGLLEVPRDAKTRRALERAKGGGGGNELAGYGIEEEDLAAATEAATTATTRSSNRRKRTVAEVAGGEASEVAETSRATDAPEQTLPWLAEHLSVRLFDATWETRHGAVLGLMALFKAWKKEKQGLNDAWVGRWTEDVACRCLCLLALDRFGDYSMGSTVAPIREVAGQLLGLVLFLGPDHFPAALGKVKVLIEQGQAPAAGQDDDNEGVGKKRGRAASKKSPKNSKKEEDVEEVAASVLTWEVRHGGFVGLKYLVALPGRENGKQSHELLEWAAKGLSDSVDDVKEAAATAAHSVVRQWSHLPVPAPVYLELLLPPVLAVLLPERSDAQKACQPAVLLMEGASGVYIPMLFQMAKAVVSRVSVWYEKYPNARTPIFPLTFGGETLKEVAAAMGEKPKACVQTVEAEHVDSPLMRLLYMGTKCRETSLRQPALDLLSQLLSFWGFDRVFHTEPSEKVWNTEQDGYKLKVLVERITYGRIKEILCALVRPVLQGVARPLTWGGGAALKGPLETVWGSLLSALGPATVASLMAPTAEQWMKYDIFSDWAARRRTAKALATMRKAAGLEGQQMTQQALKVVQGGQGHTYVDREVAALLLCECYKLVQADDDRKQEPAARTAEVNQLWEVLVAEDAKLEDEREQALASGLLDQHNDPETVRRRRFLAAAAAAVVFAEVQVDKPGTLIRGLMGAVKFEEDKERQLMAAEALAHLCFRLLHKEDKRKPVVKVMTNLCQLATFGGEERKLWTASREVLKALARLDFWRLPVLWARIEGGIRIFDPDQWGGYSSGSSGAEEDSWTTTATAEEGLRLLLVVTPVMEAEKVNSFASLAPHLVARATGDAGDDFDNSNLVNMLAARALSNFFKHFTLAKIGPLANEVAGRLHKVLQHRGSTPREEDKRPRAAYCLLEIAKALTAAPTPVTYAKAALPSLLPVALATVADDNAEVRLYGMQSFQLLVEVAPLLESEDWVSVDEAHTKPGDKSGGEGQKDAAYMARESVMRLVLGNKAAARVLDKTENAVFSLPDALPSLLRGGLVLRPYQWDGVMWLTLLRRAGLHGALCDDMGLGKTLQALVALAVTHCEEAEEDDEEEKKALPSLVLCPASLAGHWYYEARRFLSPEAIETVPYAAGLSAGEKATLLAGLGKRHLVVVSYDMLRRDAGGLLTGQAWNHVIFDEVHVLRSGATTALGRAVKRLRARHRLALTGTPLQNQVQDVWAVFDVIMPGLLGDRNTFEKEYGRPIGRATLRSANADATAEALAKLDKLHAHLLPFLLRREKGKVLQDLPPKTITDLACDLVPLQRDMYEGHCQTQQAQGVLAGLQTLVTDTNAAMAGGREGLQAQMGAQALRLLHYLRLLCVHPALVLQADSAPREQLMGEVDCSGKMVALQNLLFACGVVTDFQASEGEGEEGQGEDMVVEKQAEEEEDDDDDEEETEVAETDEATTDQGKAQEATLPQPPSSDTTIPAARPGDLHRCLIFAQHRVTLDAIEKAILRRAQWNPAYADAASSSSSSSSTRYLRLDGSVPSGQREALVQRFNRDASIPIMLLTTRVGGLGLNLTGADVVIFVEHDWNPAVDLQAMDRAHRIGQGRPVNVYRLVTRNTVEEQVLALQRRKQGLADAVVTETNAQSFEARGMASVLDLVAASVGGGKGTGGGGDGGKSAFEGGGGSGGGGGLGGVAGTAAAAPSEEAWDEAQYSAFAVESFLANIIGEKGSGT